MEYAKHDFSLKSMIKVNINPIKTKQANTCLPSVLPLQKI
jgi:hypothetical protein